MGDAPARGYSWPPFTESNTLSLKHGARSSRTIEPVAEALASELVEVAPWAARPAFTAEVQAWAWAEGRCVLLRHWLDENGILDEDDNPRAALAELHRAESQASKARTNLGLSPAAWAKLLAAMSSAKGNELDALDQLKAEGRRIVEGVEAGDDEDSDDDDQEVER